MRFNDSSHRQKWPLALISFANWMDLSLVTATSHVVPAPYNDAGVSSPVELKSLGRVIWRINCCPTGGSKGMIHVGGKRPVAKEILSSEQ